MSPFSLLELSSKETLVKKGVGPFSLNFVCTRVCTVHLWKSEVNLQLHSLCVVYLIFETEVLVGLELTH